MSSSKAIGIDFGTTYSCVGVWQNDRVEIIANDQGNRTTPSYVSFSDNERLRVGDAAKNQVAMNPVNTVFDVKRLIGRKFSDAEVQLDRRKALYPGRVPWREQGIQPLRPLLINEVAVPIVGVGAVARSTSMKQKWKSVKTQIVQVHFKLRTGPMYRPARYIKTNHGQTRFDISCLQSTTYQTLPTTACGEHIVFRVNVAALPLRWRPATLVTCEEHIFTQQRQQSTDEL
ncbi:HSP70-domain-containing protein [Hymenopellis radicata]|nr:HSP70-domain-containing protein [Hymenopellis radicata]